MCFSFCCCVVDSMVLLGMGSYPISYLHDIQRFPTRRARRCDYHMVRLSFFPCFWEENGVRV